MAREDHLIPFTSENRPTPVNAGRKKGIRNRRTIFQDWLAVKTDALSPAGDLQLISQEDQIAIAMIERAKKGDVNAAILVLDSAHGKITDKVAIGKDMERPAIDLTKLSVEELQQLKSITQKAMGSNDQYTDAEVVE